MLAAKKEDDPGAGEIVAIQQSTAPIIKEDTRAWAKKTREYALAENTDLAHEGDIDHFWQWAMEEYNTDIEERIYPVPMEMVIEYVHFCRVIKQKHGRRNKDGKIQKLATITRRLSTLSKTHELLNIKPNPIRDKRLREIIADCRRADAKMGIGPNKKKALTKDLLDLLLAKCGEDPKGIRDKAILMIGFGSGGRRRSEIAGLMMEHLTPDPAGYQWRIPFSKTDQEGAGHLVPVKGKAAMALKAWMKLANISQGPIFRSVYKGGEIKNKQMRPRDIASVVKSLAEKAGLDPDEFGGHSLRSGFVTTAGRAGVPAGSAMKLSGHKSSVVFNGYFEAGAVMENPAGDLLEDE